MTDKLPRLGLSGRLAAAFQANPITPLIALMGLLLGLVAVLVTPREEEPQIDVTMANVFVPYPGASAREVEQLVSTPLEQKLSEIEGIKHVYSISRPGMAVLTVRIQRRCAAPAGNRAPLNSVLQPGLAATGPRRGPAADQAQGHRRRAGDGLDDLVRRFLAAPPSWTEVGEHAGTEFKRIPGHARSVHHGRAGSYRLGRRRGAA